MSRSIDPAKEARAIYDVLSSPWHLENQYPQLSFLYRGIELPLFEPTVAMMELGVQVDCQVVERLREEANQQVMLSQLAPGSSAPCYNVPEGQRQLHHNQAVVAHAQALLRNIDQAGRVHPSLDSLGADTGRFSCDSPPLQGLSRELRPGIIATPGYQFVVADWKQIELQVLGFLSQDPVLLAALDSDIDMHNHTAAWVHGVAVREVTDTQRRIGKALNFAIIYGKTRYGLAADLQVSTAEAELLLQAYFARFPTLYNWLAKTREFAAHHGYVTTYHGRHRRLPDIRSSDHRAMAKAQRQAVNTTVQGTAADLHKLSLIRVFHEHARKCRLVLPLHDGVLVEAPIERVHECAATLKILLEAPLPGFPRRLPVAVQAGHSWGSMRPICV
ncbi:MAG: DNA polymerase A family protein [Pirellulales bacterium]